MRCPNPLGQTGQQPENFIELYEQTRRGACPVNHEHWFLSWDSIQAFEVSKSKKLIPAKFLSQLS